MGILYQGTSGSSLPKYDTILILTMADAILYFDHVPVLSSMF